MADNKKDTKEIKEEKKEEVKTEAKTSDKPGPKIESKPEAKPKPVKVKLTKKLEDLIGDIEKLSVLELSDLVKALEERFGVSAAPAAVPTAAATPPTGGPGAPTEGPQALTGSEQTTFNVVLASAGANKISVIKMVREINQTLGLKEAKDLVESAPKEILAGVNKSTAEEAKKKLEGAGASVELK